MRPSRILPALLLSLLTAAPGVCLSQSGAPDFRVELDPESCAFTGGSDGAGNVDVSSRTGRKMIQVSLTSNQGYRIEPVEFSGPGAEQMVSAGGGNARVVNIFNRNSGPALVKYSINLRNEQTGEITACDPQIINR